MPWSDFPVDGQVTHVQWHAFQIVSAMRERQTVTRRWLTALPVDKVTNIQDPQYWAGLQTEVDILALEFLDSAGNPAGFDNRDRGAGSLPNYTEATFWAGAGFNVAGWLRRYDDSGTITTDYGTMEAGDIIGTHIFNELYQGLQILIWTYAGATFTDSKLFQRGAAVEDDWATCLTSIATSWPNASIGDGDKVYYEGFAGDDFFIQAERPYGQLISTSVPFTAFKRDADYYAIVAGLSPTDWDSDYWTITFDDYGDGVLADKFKIVLTDSPADSDSNFVSGGYFGSTSLPSPAPTEPVPFGAWYVRGYDNLKFRIVVRWDVAGGFDYQ